MARKFLFLLIICCISLSCLIAFAEERSAAIAVNPDKKDDSSGRMTVGAYTASSSIAKGKIDIKNVFEYINNNDIGMVKHGRDGTIESIRYFDGTESRYSYERNWLGALTSCAVESEGVRVVFQAATEEKKEGIGYISLLNDAAKPSSGVTAISSSTTTATAGVQGAPRTDQAGGQEKPKDEAKSATPPVVIVYYLPPSVKVEDVARRPMKFDFKEIKESVSRAKALKDDAAKDYYKNTAKYYEGVAKKLKENAGKDANLVSFIRKADSENIAHNEIAMRKAIDEAVDYVRSDPQSQGDVGLKELVDYEKVLRGKILLPGSEAYEKKIIEAQENINSMIDKLVGSKLAVYLNLKKEKIDVVINLPEKPRE